MSKSNYTHDQIYRLKKLRRVYPVTPRWSLAKVNTEITKLLDIIDQLSLTNKQLNNELISDRLREPSLFSQETNNALWQRTEMYSERSFLFAEASKELKLRNQPVYRRPEPCMKKPKPSSLKAVSKK